MKTMFMLIGLPCSGKSTYVNSHYYNKIVLSMDIIRKAIFNVQFDIKYEKTVRSIFDEMLTYHLYTGKDVVIDNTNLAIKARSKLISKANSYNYKVVLVHLNPPITEIYKRCKLRENYETWLDIINEMQKFYKQPKRTDHGVYELIIIK